ncbi:hypothetical protein [Nocardia otitidiscaviarum]|uniref:hypothetical protein n=1 Tax=Nocardia otitidiscaviarum TaxID=1823 RepID=UPI0024568B89|nr:hypothetical protein [Nocardia otitidiscaviarum]
MFLLRRNLPHAWAGWYDDFTSYSPGDVVGKNYWPWVHLGGGRSFINNVAELVVTEQVVNDDGRGPSYEWQPFTKNWGFETEVWYPVEGLDNQLFTMGFTNSWSQVGAQFQDVCLILLYHDVGGTDKVQYREAASMWGPPQKQVTWPSPIGQFYGKTLNVRVWCDNDEWIRVWLNGSYVGSTMVTPNYALGPGRRCMRFMNRSYCNAYVREVDHYDRSSSIPPKTVWTSVVFSDDFDRADGPVGNGWTQIGSNAEIVNNSWSTISTTNGSRGLIRDIGVTSGRVRVEATVGGNIGPSSSSDSSLILLSNAAGTAGLAANIFSGSLYISRFSSSLSDDPPTFSDLDSRTDGVTVAAGDKVAFSLYNAALWIEVNDVPLLYAYTTFATVPVTNSWAGLRVGRRSGADSNSWNDVTIYQGV